MLTLTPSSEIGNCVPLKSEDCHVRSEAARPLPWIVTQEPGVIDASNEAPLTAEVIAGSDVSPRESQFRATQPMKDSRSS